MKDEEYAFHEDVREKAVTARSAHKRPRRSGCRFPQRSAKEVRELSGPVKTYQLNEPTTAAVFRTWPAEIQKQYLQGLVERYSVGPRAIGQMLGYSSSGTAYALFKKLGIKYPPRPKAEDAERFLSEFCGNSPEPMTATSFSVCLSGAFAPETVLAVLKRNIPAGQECRITVEVALPT